MSHVLIARRYRVEIEVFVWRPADHQAVSLLGGHRLKRRQAGLWRTSSDHPLVGWWRSAGTNPVQFAKQMWRKVVGSGSRWFSHYILATTGWLLQQPTRRLHSTADRQSSARLELCRSCHPWWQQVWPRDATDSRRPALAACSWAHHVQTLSVCLRHCTAWLQSTSSR